MADPLTMLNKVTCNIFYDSSSHINSMEIVCLCLILLYDFFKLVLLKYGITMSPWYIQNAENLLISDWTEKLKHKNLLKITLRPSK